MHRNCQSDESTEGQHGPVYGILDKQNVLGYWNNFGDHGPTSLIVVVGSATIGGKI